jgi:phosphoserine phosphatase
MFRNSGKSIAFNPTDEFTEDAATHYVRSDNISDILEYILPYEDRQS